MGFLVNIEPVKNPRNLSVFVFFIENINLGVQFVFLTFFAVFNLKTNSSIKLDAIEWLIFPCLHNGQGGIFYHNYPRSWQKMQFSMSLFRVKYLLNPYEAWFLRKFWIDTLFNVTLIFKILNLPKLCPIFVVSLPEKNFVPR